MNKRLKIVLILLVLLLLIPISLFAFSKIFDKIVPTEWAGSERQNLLEEKSQYSNANDGTLLVSDDSTSKDQQLIDKIDAATQESKDLENKIISIINKFYPSEFANIQSNLNDTNKISHDGNFSENSPEMQLYNLILNILETKELTTEESTILKDFMIDQVDNIKNDNDLVLKIQNACNN